VACRGISLPVGWDNGSCRIGLLLRWCCVSGTSGSWSAWSGRAPWPRGELSQAGVVVLAADGVANRDRRSGREPADGERVAVAVCGGRDRRPGRSDAAGPRSLRPPWAPPPALGVTHWSSRLLAPRLGGPLHSGRGVEGLRNKAVEGRDVQVLHRPGAGRQGDRRRRALPGPPLAAWVP
jgi:hypothetical protein